MSLGPRVRTIAEFLLRINVALANEHLLWHVLRGHFGQLETKWDLLREALDGWICAITPRTHDVGGVYYGPALPIGQRRDLPPLTHKSMRDWLSVVGSELSTWEKKLSEKPEVKPHLDACLTLMENPIDLSQEEFLSPAEPLRDVQWARMVY